jgi:hypothetical protein
MYIVLQVKCFYGTLNVSILTPFEGHRNYPCCVKWKKKSSMKMICKRKLSLVAVYVLFLPTVADEEYL